MAASETTRRKRTVTPAGNKIRQEREKRGWRVEDLMRKAQCSRVTIEDLERNEEVYPCTLKKIATAFDVPYESLVLGYVPPDSPSSDRLFKVQVTFSIPLDSINEKRFVTFIETLKYVLRTESDIAVDSIAAGSTIVILLMTQPAIVQLVDMFPLALRHRFLTCLNDASHRYSRNDPNPVHVAVAAYFAILEADMVHLFRNISKVLLPNDDDLEPEDLRGKELSADDNFTRIAMPQT